MNKIIKRGENYFYDLMIQDEVLHRGPYSSEDVARAQWRLEAISMIGWKPEHSEPPLYEAIQTVSERLVHIPTRHDTCKCCGK